MSLFKVARLSSIPREGKLSDFSQKLQLPKFLMIAAYFLASLIFFKCKISNVQHGFIQKLSTVSNLVEFHSSVAEVLISGGAQIDVVYTDIFRNFNRALHDILLQKLLMFGFSLKTILFLASYLKEGEQRVDFNGFLSEPYFHPSSVVQGSKLSGIFFAIIMDRIGKVIKHSEYLLPVF